MNHITIDAYQGNERRLDDIKSINAVLNEIVTALHLTAVMPPFLLPYYYAKESEDDGISAFTILEGGHITLHTFPKRGCIFVDLLYDGYYNEDRLVDIIKAHFLCTELQTLRTERRYLDTTIGEERIWRGGSSGKDFGPHTIAKIENVDVTFEEIFDMLDEIPCKIGMLPICRPYVIKSHKCNPSYISGVVLIAQSHIAFHYSTREKTLYCDAFSCSFYKSENFVDYLRNRYGEFINLTLIRGSKHEKKIKSRTTKVKQHSKWLDNYSKTGDNNGL